MAELGASGKPTADVRLRIDAQEYGGWKEISIAQSLEALAWTFELTVSDSWADPAGRPVTRPIVPGQACELLMDGEPLLSGYVDDVTPEYDASSRSARVKGRDVTGDLVDCSAPPLQIAGQDIQQIAAELCEPFGISVQSLPVYRGCPFPKAAIEYGETVFELLERLARQRGLLMVSDGRGAVQFTRPASRTVPTVLRRGSNILSASAEFSHKKRFSHYAVAAQRPYWKGVAPAAAQSSAVTDPEVARYRPLTLIGEEGWSIADLNTRAQWERAVRIGRSAQVVLTVAGWEHFGGRWAVNWLADVVDDWLGISEPMLITGVRFLLGEQGTRTELTLARQDAFMPEPEVSAAATVFGARP